MEKRKSMITIILGFLSIIFGVFITIKSSVMAGIRPLSIGSCMVFVPFFMECVTV